MLEPPCHVKAMTNVGVGPPWGGPSLGWALPGVGPPFPLIEKKNVLFFSFIEKNKFDTWELFNLPRCPARGPGPLM